MGKLKSAGTQVVNGTHATAYARIRYTKGDDFKRAERQRIVIQKIFEKAKTADLITINSILDKILPMIQTNLDSTKLLLLAKDIMSYDIVDETGFPFDKRAFTYHKVSYVFPVDLVANVTQLHQFLFETTDYAPSDKVKEISAELKQITDNN